MNQINSIPKATNREPKMLIVAVTVDIAKVVVQVAGPGTVCIVLRRTPPVTVVANEVESTIEVTVTARKT